MEIHSLLFFFPDGFGRKLSVTSHQSVDPKMPTSKSIYFPQTVSSGETNKKIGNRDEKKEKKKRTGWEIARAAWSVILADDFEGGARQNCRVLRRPKLAARATNKTAVTQSLFSLFSLSSFSGK